LHLILILCSLVIRFSLYGKCWEWTYILDTYNNEIIASSVTNNQGNSLPYYDCLDILKQKVKGQTQPVVLHTDQGSVYSSRAFFEAHKQVSNIKRSMSRVATPTDNPIIESLNGWIKEEMKIDFNLRETDNLPAFIDNYVHYFNTERLSAALGYKSPVRYRAEQGFT